MSEIRAVQGFGSSQAPSLVAQYRQMLKAILDVRGGADAQQTILGYQLDIDERGVLRSAPASQSQIAVTNQEQTNIRRLTAEAQARGEDVLILDVHYRPDIVDGKLALRAGHTEVVSIKREQPDAAMAVYQANREAALSALAFNLSDEGALRSLTGGLSAENHSQD